MPATITCPACAKRLSVPDNSGPAVRCPHCRQRIEIATADAPAKEVRPDRASSRSGADRADRYQARKPRRYVPYVVAAAVLLPALVVGGMYLFGNSDQRNLNRINEELYADSLAPNYVPDADRTRDQRLRKYGLLTERDDILRRHPDWPPIGPDPSPAARSLAERLRERSRDRARKDLEEMKQEGAEKQRRLDEEIQQVVEEFARESKSLTDDEQDREFRRERGNERLRELRKRKAEAVEELNRRLKERTADAELTANQWFDPNYRRGFKMSDAEFYKEKVMPASDFYLK